MKKSTFSFARIEGILKEFDNDKTAEKINRKQVQISLVLRD